METNSKEIKLLKSMLEELGLVVEEINGLLVGRCGNVMQWPLFKVWISKRGRFTVSTRGIQKSFDYWRNKDILRGHLQGFEII